MDAEDRPRKRTHRRTSKERSLLHENMVRSVRRQRSAPRRYLETMDVPVLEATPAQRHSTGLECRDPIIVVARGLANTSLIARLMCDYSDLALGKAG